MVSECRQPFSPAFLMKTVHDDPQLLQESIIWTWLSFLSLFSVHFIMVRALKNKTCGFRSFRERSSGFCLSFPSLLWYSRMVAMTIEPIEGCIFLIVCVFVNTIVCVCVCVRSKDTEDSLGCLQGSVCPLLPLYLRRDLLLLTVARTGLLVLKFLLSLRLPTEHLPAHSGTFTPTLKPLEM